MKRKVRKEPVGGSKKRKEVGNDNSLASMLRKQQAACNLSQARLAYNAQLQKGKEMRFDEAAQSEPVRRSKNDIHPIVESDTVDATVPKGSLNPNCMLKPLVPDLLYTVPKRAIKKGMSGSK
jgi:hypothetical protein